jgi:deoxyribodipyrimidine photo-lyase
MCEVAARNVKVSRALLFRRDLRLDDNPALHAAITGKETFLPLYIFDPSQFNTPSLAGARMSSARRARFLLESVSDLRKRLQGKGSGLAVFVGEPDIVLARLLSTSAQLFMTGGASSREAAEEEKIADHLLHVEIKKVWGGTLYMPEECGCNPTRAPLLFSSFRERAERSGRIRKPLDTPQTLPALPHAMPDEVHKALEYLPSLAELGYSKDEVEKAFEDDMRGVLAFDGGETAGLQRIQQWMFDDDRLKDYFRTRNGMLGEGFSSKFSPWLAVGCISPRRIWQEVQRYEAQRTKNKSTYWLIFELIWRDFFFFMGLSHGAKIFQPGGVVGDRTPWHGSPSALAKWKEGRTGDKLVDANMRELKATGFMSNRGRQNVASYLVFDLGVDWRFGAAHFEEFLLDHDPCSNWGNWVAAAGLTGQRVNRFNTKKQLSDYDPGCEYVDHWLQGPPQIRKRKRVPSKQNLEERIAKKNQTINLRPCTWGYGEVGAVGAGCSFEWCSGKAWKVL